MLMIRRAVSVLLCMVLIFVLAAPAFATQVETGNVVSFKTSETGRMEIYTREQDGEQRLQDSSNVITGTFEIRQYEDEKLVQVITGDYGGAELLVTNYLNGRVAGVEVIDLSERIVKRVGQLVTSKELTRADYGSAIGHITFKAVAGSETRAWVQVLSKLTYTDEESYTIHGTAADTLAVIVGIIASIVSVFIPTATIWREIAIAIIAAFGGSVAGGAIGIAFSEDVAVDAYYYTLTGYEALYNRYTPGTSGVARLVKTKRSNSYNEWFYENYTPANWRDVVLAMYFWMYLYQDDFPGVYSYTSYVGY